MTTEQLKQALAANLNPAALAALTGRITLHCDAALQDPSAHRGASAATDPAAVLRLHSDGQQLQWLDTEADTDVTFYFENCEHALAVLTGKADVMTEFMAGRFRSSGYLLWTFPLLSIFRA
ncbi:MAG: hypothetical protein AB8B93_04685 [Pseudomonadales bacterium]